MSRYIDADKIEYKPIVSDGEYSRGAYNGAVKGWFDIEMFASKKQIDSILTADVEPVIHAYWEKECRGQIMFPDGEAATLIERKCSNCHLWSDKEILKYYPKPAERCSKCGAKMDGKENEK